MMRCSISSAAGRCVRIEMHMEASGHKQISRHDLGESALPLKADIVSLPRYVRSVPEPGSCMAANRMVPGTAAPHQASAARRRLRRTLLPRFETALRAAARLLHDLVRVDRAAQLGDAFDARPRGSLGGNACNCHRRADFVGVAPGQRAFARSEA